MKKIRNMHFNGSWYPSDSSQVYSQFKNWDDYSGPEDTGNCCIVPHAGWYYSGKLAYSTIKKLEKNADTVVIAGGHLPSGSGIGIPSETELETPLGNLRIDTELAGKIRKDFHSFDDLRPDNTVELQLPIVKYFFKNCSILSLRIPPDKTSVDFAEYLYSIDRKFIIVGSTDLSHYGPNYSYTPYGTGKKAENKIRNEIDSTMIDHLVNADCESALKWSDKYRSACSAGAAVCSAAYASFSGKKGRLVDYFTSADISIDESFVGYAGIYYI